ncbi:type II toxin-antitoxin system RelE/ParE family toxin [Devosia sp. YIM 151766]|uniref:type II toxin-antitoxin system RelE/ParE family toxin n=1 Tax=Devosia sp. YIM 151766 TaxID=3017325 RepID=UPI00255C8009|nr:type II toxin-antitoxin system RelE/ParE family toxin [Devosia sp. YIM 151766]WIY51858.1 type II toxin-antitoxin system RelE/ParE family toxin [Devosia sp. YIM 151766]
MASFRLTPKAQNDLENIWDYIARDNLQAANELIRQIQGKIELAAANPSMGSMRDVFGEKVRMLIAGAYLIFYRPELDGILVIAVVHGMMSQESWPD